MAPLADNGGDPNGAFPLMTHALLSGSPAINAGSPTFNPNLYAPALATDQRGAGFARVESGSIDVGAFESNLASPLPADFNGNGAVDGADFLTWQRNFGKTGGIKADGDGNSTRPTLPPGRMVSVRWPPRPQLRLHPASVQALP